jgi:ABC-type transport system substrate-binding protein
VRKAFNYAIDKVGIVKSVFADRGAVLSKAPTIAEGVYGFTDMREPGQKTIFPYDPDRAKMLLKNAGYEDRDKDGIVEDVKGNKLSLNLWTRKGSTKGDHQVAQLLQSFLKDIGVDVKLTVMESAAFSSAMKLGPTKAKYDMSLLSWGIPTRKEHIIAWMQQLLRDVPVVYLPTLYLTLAERSYLHGGRILSVDNYPARFAWIDKEEMKKQGVDR